MRVIQGTGTLYEVYPVRRHGAIKRWPVRERIEFPYLIHRTGHHVHHTTGFDREEIIDLCIRINSVQPEAGSSNWPPCLGLFKSAVATLTYMRHNRTQAEIGESFGVSQPTISRAISAITPLIPEAAREFVPTADDLDPDAQRVIQGTGTLYEVYPVRRHGAIKRWPVRERIEFLYLIHRTGHHVHHTTGFDREEIIDLCIRINSVQPEAGSSNWPPCLGLFKSAVATLTYMRHNRTQAEIGESFGVSQPTISRAISAITPLIPEAAREFVPTADDLDPDAQRVIQGTGTLYEVYPVRRHGAI